MRQEGLGRQMSKILSGCEDPYFLSFAVRLHMWHEASVAGYVPDLHFSQDGLGTRLGWNWHPFSGSGNTLLVNHGTFTLYLKLQSN